MTVAHTARPAVPWLLGGAGFVAGGLVNLAGIAGAFAGWGLWVYWVLMTVAVMAGVATWRADRSRWFGAGLTVGCVTTLVVVLGVTLAWVG